MYKQINQDFKFKRNIEIVQKEIFKKIDKNFKISLIKIDVNGHELSVVGLRNIIKDKPALIIETDKNINRINEYLEKYNIKILFLRKKDLLKK